MSLTDHGGGFIPRTNYAPFTLVFAVLTVSGGAYTLSGGDKSIVTAVSKTGTGELSLTWDGAVPVVVAQLTATLSASSLQELVPQITASSGATMEVTLLDGSGSATDAPDGTLTLAFICSNSNLAG